MNETKPSETKPKKMVRRSVAIALGIICIIFITLVAYFSVTGILAQNNYDNLQSQNKQLQESNANFQNQNRQLQTWLFGNESLLFWQEVWLNGNITYYNSQITNLQNQLSNFTLPKLGFSDLTAVDNRTNPNNTFLQVNGTIHNFGIDGTMAGLTVKAYHNDGSIALDNELLGSLPFLNIDGQSSINVNLNYYYNGSALASWTISAFELIYI
jgi:hypothetical protein